MDLPPQTPYNSQQKYTSRIKTGDTLRQFLFEYAKLAKTSFICVHCWKGRYFLSVCVFIHYIEILSRENDNHYHLLSIY